MPIYEYACDKCGKLNEVLQKVSDPPPAKCDGCQAQGPLVKVVSRSSFQLKGGGWYSDLYSSTKKDKSSGGGSSSSASTPTSAPAKNESTPSTSSTPKSDGGASKS